MMVNLNEYEKIILNHLKKLKDEISIRKLSKLINISYPTTLKYINSLELKNKIIVKDFGNKKLIKIKKV